MASLYIDLDAGSVLPCYFRTRRRAVYRESCSATSTSLLS